jgi:hypothetical protein
MKKFPLLLSFVCPPEYINPGFTQFHIEKNCNSDDPKTFNKHSSAMTHWVERHAASALNAPGYYNCWLCKLGFFSREMYVAHLRRSYGDYYEPLSDHSTTLRQTSGIWTPDVSYIHVTSSSRHPSYTELYAIHMASVDTMTDHAIAVFRQSNPVKDFNTSYLQLVTRIAGNAVAGLHDKANITAASIVASRSTRSRLVPIRATDPPTEMRMIEDGWFDDYGTKRTIGQIPCQLNCAARATHNITNQILRANMDGRRPLLIFMGTNAFSANWERTMEFICNFHEQYGTLNVALRVPESHKRSEHLQDSLDVLCPYVVGAQAFGFFDSRDFVRFAQGHADAALDESRNAMDGHTERAFSSRRVMRKHGSRRIEKARGKDRRE